MFRQELMKLRGFFLIALFLHFEAISIVYANPAHLKYANPAHLKKVDACISKSSHSSTKSQNTTVLSWKHASILILFLTFFGLILKEVGGEKISNMAAPSSGVEPRVESDVRHNFEWTQNMADCKVSHYGRQWSQSGTIADNVRNISRVVDLVVHQRHLPALPSAYEVACEIDHLVKKDRGYLPTFLSSTAPGKWSYPRDKLPACNNFGLDEIECTALSEYTHNVYKRLNANLRKDPIEQEPFWAVEAALSRGLSKLPPHSGWTFRDDRTLSYAEAQDLFQVGEVFGFSTFISTTAFSDEKQDRIDQQFPSADHTSVIFKILSKTGRSIKDFSHFPEEMEVLFQPNSAFKVESVVTQTKKEQSITFITIKEVTPPMFRPSNGGYIQKFENHQE